MTSAATTCWCPAVTRSVTRSITASPITVPVSLHLRKRLADEGRDLPLRGEMCWNVFMNNVVEDGKIVTYEPPHPAGSTIAMEAMEDLVVALSACPQDISAVNAFNPTPMALRVKE